MAKTRSEVLEEAIQISGGTVDEAISRMSNRLIKDVVCMSEGMTVDDIHYTIGMVGAKTAADYLVARLFTDAVFSDDIRSIQLIINRIDGGLPKDTEVAYYQTEFGDCLNAVMQMTSDQQVKIDPNDTVMMALCKNLYQMAVQDIYWNPTLGISRRPSEAQKKERDPALRMVLERTGGRKTLVDIQPEKEKVEIAGWIAELPEITS